MTLHSNARRRRAAWAAAGLLAAAGTLGASGFPTFDVAAFGQRAVERIQSASQVTYLATIVTNTLAMLETLDDTLDHAFDVAEGAVGSVQDMASLMPGLELGQGQSLLDWKGRATRIRQRAANLASSAALPGPDAWAAAWAADITPPSTRTPPVPLPGLTREELARQRAEKLSARQERFAAVLGERADAGDRVVALLDDVAGKLRDVAGDSGSAGTALWQKQLAVQTASSDLVAGLLQVEALRDQAELEREIAEREALAAIEAAVADGVRSAFEATGAVLQRYDAAAADESFRRPVLPDYGPGG